MNAANESLTDVALIDAGICAATGGMSVSWWQEEVRAGRAPKPAVQRPRCTRWRLVEVRAFWRSFADAGAAETQNSDTMKQKLAKASAKTQDVRSVKASASKPGHA